MKKHLSTIVIAIVVSSLAAAAPVIAHGVEHALFAHEAAVANNARHLGGQSPGAYVKNKGEIVVTMPYSEWRTNATDVNVQQYGYEGVTFRKTAAGNADFTALPEIPEVMYGKRLRMEGVEICVDASDEDVSYTYVEVQSYKNEDDDFFTGPTAEGHGDVFTIDSQGCHVYPFEPPVVLGPGRVNGVFLDVGATWQQANADFTLGRASVILEPTKKAAPQLVP